MADTWYFAYGSNMWIDQKVKRTGAIRQGAERPRIGTLKDWRPAFNKRSSSGAVVANIIESPGDEVMGVVYRWDQQSRDTMRDEFEIGYEEKWLEVTTNLGETLKTLTFVALPSSVCDEGSPSAAYLAKIVDGARQHSLPEEYIQRIEQLAQPSKT